MKICHPKDRPVQVNFIRNSPLAQEVDKRREAKENIGIFISSMDCDYYLSSAYYHYRNISDFYCKEFEHALRLNGEHKKMNREKNNFGNASHFAYFIYMEFDAYLVTVRIIQNKLLDIIRNLYKEAIPNSMSDFLKKERTDKSYGMIKEYRDTSGKTIKDLRDNLVHHQRMSSYPSASIDIEKREVKLLIPSNPECKSRNGIRYNGLDVLEFVKKSLCEIQDLSINLAKLL